MYKITIEDLDNEGRYTKEVYSQLLEEIDIKRIIATINDTEPIKELLRGY